MGRIKSAQWLAAFLIPCFCALCFPSSAQVLCPDDQGTPSVPCINSAGFLSFFPPPNSTPEQQVLIADIVSLDHRAHEQLGAESPEWKEVLGMLSNAAYFVGVSVGEARELYKRADQSFMSYVQAKNRIKYLIGLILGVVVTTLLTGLLYVVARSLDQPFIAPRLLPLLCLFAGLGTLTSVLTRLDEIYLKNEAGTALIMIDGGARPVVAIFFALVVYLILDLKVLDIKFGSPTGDNQNSIYLISSFLCGFSERFAESILSKVVPVLGGAG
jgi:hypothetical protein